MTGTGRRATLAWAMYDWANSAFATVVLAGFFPIFYRQQWASSLPDAEITFTLALANSVSGVLLILFAPLLGSLVDAGGRRKRFLLSFAFFGAGMTLLLGLLPAGEWRTACVVYAAAASAFMFGNVFYDALLIEVSGRGDYERVSSLGYALGYAGGGLLFALLSALYLGAERFGIAAPETVMRGGFYAAGLWWLVFTLPLLWWLPERRRAGDWVREGVRRFTTTLGLLRSNRELLWFLLAYWLYIDGVGTIIRMAVDYGYALGFGAGHLVTALLAVQFVGVPATLLFGRFAARVGARRALFTGIAVYVVVCTWAAAIETLAGFYALALLIGLVQGGVQAQSRSLFSRLAPAGRITQLFGVYNLLGRFAVIVGPLVLGWVGLLTGSPRFGILSVAVLFIAGAAVLCKVPRR